MHVGDLLIDKISYQAVYTNLVVMHFRSNENQMGGYYSIRKHTHEMQRKAASQMDLV